MSFYRTFQSPYIRNPEQKRKFHLISLDIFQESPYAKDINELNGWLTLLTTENVEQVDTVIRRYPWLTDIYRDMNEYLHRPREVLGMYSEALRILDRNTTEYMIEELQREVAQTKKAAAARILQAQKEAQRQTAAAESGAAQALVEILQETGATPEAAAAQLTKRLSLSQEQAQAYINRFWNTEASEDTHP